MKNILVVIDSDNLKSVKVLLEKSFRLLPETLKVLVFDTSFINEIEVVFKRHENSISEVIDYSTQRIKNKAKTVLEVASECGADLVTIQRRKAEGQSINFSFEKELLKGLKKANLLMCGDISWNSTMKVLGTIDVVNESKEQNQLNSSVLDVSVKITDIVNAELHFASVIAISRVSKELDIVSACEVLSAKGDSVKAKLEDFIKAKNVQVKCKTHVTAGLPYIEIPLAAKKLKIDLAILGNVGRTGIKGLIVGDTAEKILQRLSIDTLIVKK